MQAKDYKNTHFYKEMQNYFNGGCYYHNEHYVIVLQDRYDQTKVWALKHKYDNDFLRDCEINNVPEDAELVIVEAMSSSKNWHNETEWTIRYYSVSDKASLEAYQSIDLDVSKKPDIRWGSTTGFEPVKPTGSGHYMMSLDKFYYIKNEYWSTF